MEDKLQLVGRGSTYEDQKKLTQYLLEDLTKHVAPGVGIILSFAKQYDGSSQLSTYSCSVEDISCETRIDVDKPLDVALQAERVWKIVGAETEPETVDLSGMWSAFETHNYITQQVREDIETAIATHNKIPSELWVVLPGLNCVMGFPEDYPRSFLENVFLAHVYDHLSGVVQAGKAHSFLKTKGTNRPEITGLSKVPRVVRAGDMETVRDVLSAVALELITRGVKIGDSYQHNKLELAARKAANHYWE